MASYMRDIFNQRLPLTAQQQIRAATREREMLQQDVSELASIRSDVGNLQSGLTRLMESQSGSARLTEARVAQHALCDRLHSLVSRKMNRLKDQLTAANGRLARLHGI